MRFTATLIISRDRRELIIRLDAHCRAILLARETEVWVWEKSGGGGKKLRKYQETFCIQIKHRYPRVLVELNVTARSNLPTVWTLSHRDWPQRALSRPAINRWPARPYMYAVCLQVLYKLNCVVTRPVWTIRVPSIHKDYLHVWWTWWPGTHGNLNNLSMCIYSITVLTMCDCVCNRFLWLDAVE